MGIRTVVTMTITVEITLLGGFEARIDGRRCPAGAFARRDAAALVKLLALAPGRCLHREQVMEALWPGVDPATAAPRLHKAAHYVRRASGMPAAMVLAGQTIALFPEAEVVTDVERFQAAARRALAGGDRAAMAAVLAEWDATLLPGDLYEEWAHDTRERIACLREQLEHVLSEAGSGRAERVAMRPVPSVGPTLEQLAAEVQELRRVVAAMLRAEQSGGARLRIAS